MRLRWTAWCVCGWLLIGGCSPMGRSLQTIARQDLMLTSEQNYRAEYGRRIRLYLRARRFDRLEAIVDSLERHDPRWPSGRAYALSFYENGFGKTDDATPESWETQLSLLREWADQHPEAAVPRLALAEALIGRAWDARGTGWARDVSDRDFRRFHSDLAEARGILVQCPEQAKSSREWFSAMLHVLHGLGEDARYRETASEAIARFPSESRFYTGMAGHLLPRWFGAPGEWEAFAERAASALPDSIADEFYARMLADEAPYADGPMFGDGGTLSWPKARKGCEDWHRRWPASTEPISALALLAWGAGDLEVARRSFAALGDTCNLEVWNNLQNYWSARHWTEKGTRPRA
jgi:hypothetical protein